MQEKDIVCYQVTRQVRNLGIASLILLEESHEYIKKLETLLISMGIDKYKESNFNYSKDRKTILDKTGDTERDLIALINSFEITLEK